MGIEPRTFGAVLFVCFCMLYGHIGWESTWPPSLKGNIKCVSFRDRPHLVLGNVVQTECLSFLGIGEGDRTAASFIVGRGSTVPGMGTYDRVIRKGVRCAGQHGH